MVMSMAFVFFPTEASVKSGLFIEESAGQKQYLVRVFAAGQQMEAVQKTRNVLLEVVLARSVKAFLKNQ